MKMVVASGTQRFNVLIIPVNPSCAIRGRGGAGAVPAVVIQRFENWLKARGGKTAPAETSAHAGPQGITGSHPLAIQTPYAYCRRVRWGKQ
jgi:hypothetical protein